MSLFDTTSRVRVMPGLLCAVAGLACTCAAVFAQPGMVDEPRDPPRDRSDRGPRGQGPEEQPEHARPEAARDPEVLKRILRSKIEEAQGFTSWGEEAIKRLEQGEAPYEIWQESLRFAQEFRRFQPQMGRRGGVGMKDDLGVMREGPRTGDEVKERREGPGKRFGKVSDAERAEIMAFMREHLPLVADRIESTRQTEPELSDKMFNRLAPRLREAVEVKERDPKLFELRTREIKAGIAVVDSMRALRDASRVEDAGTKSQRTTQAEAELRTALADQYDVRTSLRQHEIEDLRKRIERMQTDVNERAAKKDNAINETMARVEAEGLRGDIRDEPMPPPEKP